MGSMTSLLGAVLRFLDRCTHSDAAFRRSRLAAVVLVVLVALPRFDMNDAGIGSVTGDTVVHDSLGGTHARAVESRMTSPDVRQYTSMVRTLRGEDASLHGFEQPAAPFAYRFLLPAMASLVPAPALTALDLVNLLMLVVCILLLDSYLAAIGMERGQRVAGMLMFALSFPVFYYGATGRIDAGGLASMLLILAAHARGRSALLFASAFMAPLAKETTVLAIGMCVLVDVLERRPHTVRRSGMLIALFVAGSVASRLIAPVSSTHVWNPSVADTMTNLLRPRAYLSSLLSFGVPGLLAAWHVRTTRRSMRAPFERALMLSVLGCCAVWMYSFVAAYTDGRFVWIAYPFLIPLAVLALRRSDAGSTHEARRPAA